MKKKFSLFFLIIIFSLVFNNNVIAKPRCEVFFEEVYNQTTTPRDVDYFSVGDEISIGIQLKSKPSEDGSWELQKNYEGYYLIGKIHDMDLVTTDPDNFDKIKVNDILISINDEDLRNNYDEDEYSSNVSELYENGQEINFKLKRVLSDGKEKTFEIKTKARLSTYQQPLLDVFINNISPIEKDGSYEISITTDFAEDLGPDYNLTQLAHKNLMTNMNLIEYPSQDEIENGDYTYEECSFSEQIWSTANSRDPAYGVIFKNIVFEDKNKRKAAYRIIPYFDKDDNFSKQSLITYELSTTLKIKNDFNLKTFPFDKQKIKFELSNSRYDVNDMRITMTDWTSKKALEYIKENSIPGWKINNFVPSYANFVDPFDENFYYDGFQIIFELERKSRYYIFKIILPIVLILMVCWSVVWVNPKELESRLTITIVCLLSLIAYNFVIDKDLPKLEYLTILDWIILISYVYATIPNFLSIFSFAYLKKKNKTSQKIELISKKYGALSYIIIIFLIVFASANLNPEFTSSSIAWLSHGK